MAVFALKRGQLGPPPPASVSSPVSGTDLTAVWRLQYSGTGPRTSASNGTWSTVTAGAGGSQTNLPVYLQGKSCKWNNYGDLWFDVGASNVTISNYDFTGAPYITMNATTGSITFVDCTFNDVLTNGTGTSISGPTNINRGIDTTAGRTTTFVFQYCTFKASALYAGSGTFTFSRCNWNYMAQGACDVAQAYISYDWCYFPGGGTNPPAGSHVELTQFGAATPQTFSLTNSLIDVAAQGQASVPLLTPNYGWTGCWTFPGNGQATVSNNIFKGLQTVNANPVNPDRVACCVSLLAAGSGNVVTNNVFDFGSQGYVKGKASISTISGNRSYANAALGLADFGS